MELPILPLNLASGATELEGHTLGLGDLNGLQIRPVTALALDGKVMVVHGGGLDDRPADLGDIDGNDLLLEGVPDGAEVQGVLVLAVVDVGPVVQKRLLQAPIGTEALIVADRPRVGVDLVHILGGDTTDDALLDDLGIGADTVFNGGELFRSNLDSRIRIKVAPPSPYTER